MSMIFLSAAPIPAAMLPQWAQTLAQFMPPSCLVTGFQGIFLRHQNLLDNAGAVVALLLTMLLGTFLAVQLFRWEKEEKIRPRNKLWVLAVLAPFVATGIYRGYNKGKIVQKQALFPHLPPPPIFSI